MSEPHRRLPHHGQHQGGTARPIRDPFEATTGILAPIAGTNLAFFRRNVTQTQRLSAVAFFLAFESRSLLIGEAADPEMVESVYSLVQQDADVVRAGRPLTMHFGPEDVLLNLDVRFRSGLPTEGIMGVVGRLQHEIRERHPEIKRIFIEPESLSQD